MPITSSTITSIFYFSTLLPLSAAFLIMPPRTANPALMANWGNTDDEPFKFSIWLMPPETETVDLQSAIQEFAEDTPSDAGESGPSFVPHITVAGGLECPSMDFFETHLLPALQETLTRMPTVPCHLDSEPAFGNTWNQACVLLVDKARCEAFTKLVETCWHVLCQHLPNQDGCALKHHAFPPPLCAPHLSLYYGTEHVPTRQQIADRLSSMSQPFQFEGTRIAIWNTTPGSLEGVRKWEELAVIDLGVPSRLDQTQAQPATYGG